MSVIRQWVIDLLCSSMIGEILHLSLVVTHDNTIPFVSTKHITFKYVQVQFTVTKVNNKKTWYITGR